MKRARSDSRVKHLLSKQKKEAKHARCDDGEQTRPDEEKDVPQRKYVYMWEANHGDQEFFIFQGPESIVKPAHALLIEAARAERVDEKPHVWQVLNHIRRLNSKFEHLTAMEKARVAFFDESWKLYLALLETGCFYGPWWTYCGTENVDHDGMSRRLLNLECDAFTILAHPSTFELVVPKARTTAAEETTEPSAEPDAAAVASACKHVYIWYSLEEDLWLCSLLCGSKNEVDLAHNLMVGTISVSTIETTVATQALDVLQFLRDTAAKGEQEEDETASPNPPDALAARSPNLRFNLGVKLHRLGSLNLKHWRCFPFSSPATVNLSCSTVTLAHWRSTGE